MLDFCGRGWYGSGGDLVSGLASCANAALLGLLLGLLLLLLAGRRGGGGGVPGWLLEPPGPGAPGPDVVGLAVKPTCVNALAVRSLNRFLRPRAITVVAPSEAQCAHFRAMAANVRCVLEDAVVPGVTKAAVEARLRERYGAAGAGSFSGRANAGWYLQQFVKLGAARHLPGLSEDFVLWDMDMILLREPRVFEEAPGGARAYVFNTGGYDASDYAGAYERLVGRELENAPDGSSFVTHWMAVHRPWMEELLRAFAGGAAAGEPGGDQWPWRILDAVGRERVHKGFSEYASYASWVRQRHPEAMRLQPKNWQRHPPGGRYFVSLQRLLHPSGLCCPSGYLLDLMRARGNVFMGFEIGHDAFCQYNHPLHAESYGLSGGGAARGGGARARSHLHLCE